jgi:WD40 repeat protein
VSVGMRVALGVAGVLALLAPTAKADVIAVLEHRAPSRSDNDIVRVNAGTGATTPAAFNTTEDEVDPSVSSDGNRIAFERFVPVGGAGQMNEQLMVNDLHTGRTATVFDQSQILASDDAQSPSISPDGQTLLTGSFFQQFADAIYFSQVKLSSLSTFPNGPYTQSTFQPQFSFSSGGLVSDPVESGSLVAFQANDEIVLGQLGGNAVPPLASNTVEYQHPTFGSPGGVPTVLFVERSSSTGSTIALASRPASPLSSFAGPPTPLPAAVNTGSDALDPAFTSDGRYIGYLRGFPNNPDWFLFVWDTETQTLVNPAGVDVGDISVEGQVGGGGDNLGLYELTVFRGPGAITSTGTVNFHLASDSAVGILIQRVVGHHKLFGRTVPTLKLVGHVPLGRFKQGRRHAHWDLRVNGRRLKRGTYQVTLRSLTASEKIRDFGVPHLIRVR